MNKFLILIIVHLITGLIADEIEYYKIETALKSKLFRNYDKNVKPSKIVNISFDTSLEQIVSLDEKNQIITTSTYLYVNWNDNRLVWQPSDFNQTDQIKITATRLWLPDLFVINTADTNGFITYSNLNLASLNSSGYLNLLIGLIGLKTRCELNIRKLPFDTQNCKIQIGSWQREKDDINMMIDGHLGGQSTDDFTPNLVWALVGFDLFLMNSTSRFFGKSGYSNDLNFVLKIKRKPLYYMTNNVYPCLILNLVTLITFFLPFSLQATLSITSFLNMAIISVRVSNDIPIQSEYLPLITLYFFLSLLYAFISFAWFVYLEDVKSKKNSSQIIKLLLCIKHKINCTHINKVKPKNDPQQTLEKETDRFKNEIEQAILSLNYIALMIMFLAMFVSFLSIWLIITSP